MFWFLIVFIFFPFLRSFGCFERLTNLKLNIPKLVLLDFLKVNFSDELDEFQYDFLCVNWNSIVV